MLTSYKHICCRRLKSVSFMNMHELEVLPGQGSEHAAQSEFCREALGNLRKPLHALLSLDFMFLLYSCESGNC